MRRLEINRTGNYHLTEGEKEQLENALEILARLLAKAMLDDVSLVERSRYEECLDSAERAHQATGVASPDEPLTLSVRATAKILGLSRGSTYEAIHAGQIPSIRFGKRIVVPHIALNKMISQADNCKSRDRQRK